MRIDARAIHLHPVLLKAEAIDLDRIGMIAVAQFDGVADVTANLRPSAQGRSVELRLFDAAAHARKPRWRPAPRPRRRTGAKDAGPWRPGGPASRCRLSRPALPGGPAVPAETHDCWLPPLMTTTLLVQHSLKPRKRFLAVLAVGDDLGDHGVEVGGNGVAFLHTGVDSHSRPGQHAKALDRARSRAQIRCPDLRRSAAPQWRGRWFAAARLPVVRPAQPESAV